MNTAVDEIKERLSIEDVVSQYVQLKKAGRSLKGLCPFHTEKTPSFIVSPDKQIAYCFGCNKGGDVFSFIQEVEGVDFQDALKILAERAGINLDGYKIEKKVQKGQKEEFFDLYEKVAVFYEKKLWQTEKGAKVLEYLRKRGISDDMIRLFRIGFSPDSFEETYTMLLNRGFTKKTLVSAGIAQTKETTIDKIYDRFRGRLMFPIFDNLGRIVGFGGRALSKDQEPKYLNSPETAIYHKSKLLYGFSHAKKDIKESEAVIIVEGYMDLISTFQSGVKNVVASSGTAFTSSQLRLLKPYAKKIYLAFDMDTAGEEAAKRAFEISQEFDFEVYVLQLPEGKDPDEYIKSGGDLREVIKKAALYGDYLYKKLLDTYGMDTLSAKRKIIAEFMQFFRRLGSRIERDEYVRKMARDMGLTEVQIYDEITNLKLPDYHPARLHSPIDESVNKTKKYSVEQLILGFLIEFTRVTKSFMDKLSPDCFSDDLKPIYKAIVDKYNVDSLDSGNVLSAIPSELKEKSSLLSLYVTEKYGEMSEEEIEREMAALINSVKKNIVGDKAKILQRKINEAENAGDKKKCKELLEELSKLYIK
jgi:DNA primase